MEANEVAVRIGDEELLNAGFGVFVDAVPLCLGFHEDRVIGVSQGGEDRIEVPDADLEVDSSPEGWFQGCSDPISADALLLEHDVSRPQRDVGEALLGALVVDLEPAEPAPELDAFRDAADQQLRHQGWVKSRVSHMFIVADDRRSAARV